MTGAGTETMGRVAEISGARVTVVLEQRAREGDVRVDGWPDLQIGALVRLPTRSGEAYGIVQSLRIDFSEDRERRFAEVQLLGEALDGKTFARGVSAYPALGASVLPTTQRELAVVYARPASVPSVRIGALFQDPTLPAFALTNDLLGKHFAVLGTTGCGKSCAVAVILNAMLDQHPEGHIVMLDPHNEYGAAFGERAEQIRASDLELPYWLLNFEEACAIMISTRSDTYDQEAAILKSAILDARQRYPHNGRWASGVSVDAPTPYRLTDLIRTIDSKMADLGKPETSVPFLRLKARIDALKADKRLAFMFPGHVIDDTFERILSRLFRIPVRGKPVSLLDISGMPGEIVDVVVSVICRMIFDYALWSERDTGSPMLLVCEEAHRYIPNTATAAFEPTRRAIARIAKEGRKYGISLCLVSQRPSELPMSILSQCNTLFVLRMSNERDHEFVRNALPESAQSLVSTLPALRTQEAIVVGEGVSVPVRMRLDDLPPDRRPRSDTALFSESWQQSSSEATALAATIRRWRDQDHDRAVADAKAGLDSIIKSRTRATAESKEDKPAEP